MTTLLTTAAHAETAAWPHAIPCRVLDSENSELRFAFPKGKNLDRSVVHTVEVACIWEDGKVSKNRSVLTIEPAEEDSDGK